MHKIKLASVITTLTLVFGCKLFQPTVHFIISNSSTEKTPVAIQVKIGKHSVFNDSIHYTNVRPDIQYTPSIILPKGKYSIAINADSGKARLFQPIMVNRDCWVFISYNFKAPTDSIQRKKLLEDFGYDKAYMDDKLKGTPSQVGIYIMDRPPTFK